ncbi:neural cell adhesion molecule L1 isoform X2 [Tiliqua scincoides]|uniref:neural cell adhesion molecule L1 isoform X2 n=1 Tax=Tiliqua scincoides TaxID=71010 RepID=UPI0034634504
MPGKTASMLSCLLMLWTLVLLLCDPAVSIQLPEGLQQPPEFTEQPEPEIVVFPTDEVTLKCEATGKPELMFRWTKDGLLFDPDSEPGMMKRNGSGTLVITTNNGNVATRFQGVYRCYASNGLGTAMSTESRIVAESAPQWPKEKVAPIVVEEEASVILPCNPPTSAASPKIYWLNSMIQHFSQNERVTMGQDGNLYFANVEIRDSHPDYICNVHFQGPRIIIQKEPIELKVYPTNSLVARRPRLMLPKGTTSSYVALLGKDLVLECIVEGFPTPSVEWVQMNRLTPSDRLVFENFNRTLHIPNVVVEDDGEYQCIAHNKHGTVRHNYYVTVEAAPYWIQKPVSQIYGPGENVRLDCKAYGKPKPKMTWRVNGVLWDELEADPKRTRNHQGSLILSKVQPNDTAVFQCEAHNKHGSLLANAYIHVVRLPAQILTPNGKEYGVVVNQTVILDCKTFGAPGPTVKWFTEDMYPALEDSRMSEYTNGSLQIEQVQLEDAGNFTCVAENDQNNISIIAILLVKEPTRVEVMPLYIEAKTGYSVTFHCIVQFDKTIPKLSTKWRRDGRNIENLGNSDKYFMNYTSLTINSLDYSDQGTYSCLAETRFDSVEKSARLLVVGKPGPVSDLELSVQQDWEVKLTWTPADDHNSPIEKYVVFFEESFSGPNTWIQATTVPGNQPWAMLSLSPYGNYRFKVLAKNKHGESDRSPPSRHYETDPAAPGRNPSDVKGEGSDPNNMIITWTPLPRIDWNAPHLHYHVQWRLKDHDSWNETEVEVPPVVVRGTPVFSPYEIKVQARNEYGKGPEPSIFSGYSGEKIPEAVPDGIGIEVINSTTIKLSWLLSDKERVWGHIKGFKVYYLRKGDADRRSRRHTRSHNHHGGELLIEGEVYKVRLGGLRPWSMYDLQMTVLNGKGEGPRSEIFSFVTPEGVPSAPESFHLDYLSDTALMLEWKPPRFPNGILRRYVLTYQQVNQTVNVTEVGLIGSISIPPDQFRVNLSDLIHQVPYKFYLSAETTEGQGESFVLEEHAMRESVNLSFVNISLSETGENFTTIIWSQPPNQRDVEFAVHVMSKTDKEPWRIVGKASSSQGSYSIPDLQPGKRYLVRLVKVHRTGDNQTIWETDVETENVATPSPNFAKEGWFIGFISAIVLLILVLVLLCFIKRSKGGKYSVKDKEDTQVDSEARPMKDETFGEYSDNEEKPFTSSQPSLNGDIKALGSDDSLADYGGSVDVQFNEDGSFIGQYSGHKGKDGGGNDSSGATSPTNVATVLE